MLSGALDPTGDRDTRARVPKVSYATPGEPCRCDSDLTTPWQRTRLELETRGRTGFTSRSTIHKAHVLRAKVYKTALAGAPHKASVQDLVKLVERREELGRHLLVRPVGRVDALELLLLVGALRVEQQVQEKHNQ